MSAAVVRPPRVIAAVLASVAAPVGAPTAVNRIAPTPQRAAVAFAGASGRASARRRSSSSGGRFCSSQRCTGSAYRLTQRTPTYMANGR